MTRKSAVTGHDILPRFAVVSRKARHIELVTEGDRERAEHRAEEMNTLHNTKQYVVRESAF